MSITVSIPGTTAPLNLQLELGETLYVLGANGTGKSALMHRLNVDHNTTSRWIAAHRRTWLQSGGSNLTPANKEQSEQNLRQWTMRADARWLDFNPDIRVNVAIFDLIHELNKQNQQIADAVRAKDETKARQLAERNEDPLVALSGLLRNANLPFNFSIDANAAITTTRPGSLPYSAAEMSDGERNALLLTAEVMTVPPGTLILIDEPELHLHRSIISPLLNGLFSKRPDCGFVISTHEVMLPVDNPTSKTLLVRQCTYQNGSAVSWDVDLVESSLAVDEDLKKDILGARRDVLFVEGEESSLDGPLYSLILPNVSVIPKGSSRDVKYAVTSLRGSNQLHWIRAFGIVDNDGRAAGELDELRQGGIFPTKCYSVESIYYDLKVMENIAAEFSKVTGDDPKCRIERAKQAGLNAVKESSDHLTQRSSERRIRNEFFKHVPNRKCVDFAVPMEVRIDAPGILASERQTLSKSIDCNDLGAIIRSYPIRETPALDRIPECLGFKCQKDYEKAVLQLLKNDSGVLDHVKGLLGGLPGAIMKAGASQ